MFFYEILLVTGALGLIAMALVGFVHAGGPHHSGHAGGGHAGHALQVGRLGHGSHAGHAAGSVARHGTAEPARATASPGEQRGALGRSVLSLLSPITLFAACLGAGATGSLLTGWGAPPLAAGAGAAAGAVVFNALLVRPMMRLVMGFASTPARALDGTLMQSAEAITAFDANGEGLVRVLVDGQSVDVLARLTEEERRQGARVVRGQSVRIEDVDGHNNRCIVSRL